MHYAVMCCILLAVLLKYLRINILFKPVQICKYVFVSYMYKQIFSPVTVQFSRILAWSFIQDVLPLVLSLATVFFVQCFNIYILMSHFWCLFLLLRALYSDPFSFLVTVSIRMKHHIHYISSSIHRCIIICSIQSSLVLTL